MIEPILFPYLSMPVRLEFGDKKNKTVCFFSCNEHLQSYLNRYKLDKRTIKINYRDGEPTKSSKTNKAKVRQTTGKNSDGSGGRSKRSTKNVDFSGTIGGSNKSKK